MNNLSKQVEKLEMECATYKELIGEIIATVRLPQNVVYFDKMPAKWHEIVDEWDRRWKELNDVQPCSHPSSLRISSEV